MKIQISPAEGTLSCPRTAWLLIITAAVMILSLAVMKQNRGFHELRFDVTPKKSEESVVAAEHRGPDLTSLLLSESESGHLYRKLFQSWYQKISSDKLKSEQTTNTDSEGKLVLHQALPSEAGMDSLKLSLIDSIVLDAIQKGAMPGAQVFVARKGMIVYEKAFGYHDYSMQIPVSQSDLYDIASITKIAATTLAAMKLTQDGKLDLDAPLGKFFKDTTIRYTNLHRDTLWSDMDTLRIPGKIDKETAASIKGRKHRIIGDSLVVLQQMQLVPIIPQTNIFRITLKDLLAHKSGINPSLPVYRYLYYADTYQHLLESGYEQPLLAIHRLESEPDFIENSPDIFLENVNEVDLDIARKNHYLFSNEEAFDYFFSRSFIEGEAETAITPDMYLRKQFSDSLYQAVKQIRVKPEPKLQYSCVNMILLQMVMDSINQTDLDNYLKQIFFADLGMHNTTFNPLKYFPSERIIPTEEDYTWREQLVHGSVHDPSAAMLGGIAGNAGLFSTASDLGILGQMLLNKGSYNHKQYLDPQTIELFTQTQPESHRGLGFDKPFNGGIHADDASLSSYGHLGFTGGAMWIDPENEIVFIFLSNRISPNANNNLISQLRVRQRVHQAVYDALVE